MIYPTGRRHYVVHIGRRAMDVIGNHIRVQAAIEHREGVIDVLCGFAGYAPGDIHIIEADGKDNLLAKMLAMDNRRYGEGQKTLEAWA